MESLVSEHIKKLAADIVTAYIGKTATGSAEVPGLIGSTYKALVDALEKGPEPPAHTRDHQHHDHHHQEPAVDPRKSVFPDKIVCLEDGLPFATIKRHLSTAHSMTVAEYKLKWGLPYDYPVVAPKYAEQRSKLAKKIGLGRK
jgi:predicted transcriptional regulator